MNPKGESRRNYWNLFIYCLRGNLLDRYSNILMRTYKSNLHLYRHSLCINPMCFNGNERSHYLDIRSPPCYRSVQRFMTKELQVIGEKLTLQQCCCKNARRDLHPHFRTSIGMFYRRKLLGHERKDPMRRRKSNRTHWKTIAVKKAGLRKKRRNTAAATKKTALMNDKNTNHGIWDDWNNWSVCSVTCGQGRQVRWRHCLSENCNEGLKKAQMRSCRVTDCEKKGFLGWLGIKS